jgi:2-polyprenyl-3-methyl-5-hydroxy-6-metoxy-1,4-benzoquinol methylase
MAGTEHSAGAARFFDEFASRFDTLYDEQRGPLMRWVDRRFRSDMFTRFALTFEALGDLSGKSVLDIGCGSGPYVLEALRRGAASVTGLDPAPRMLELASARLAGTGLEQKARFVSGLFPGTALEPHDAAIVMGVLDYVEDAEAFLRELRPLVRELAALSFPSRHWLRTPLRKARYTLRRCPVYFYDAEAIERLSRRTGWSSAKVYKIPGAGLDYHVCLVP